MSEERKFKVGDLVRVKGFRKLMTVTHVESDGVRVFWFRDDEPIDWTFPIECLVYADAGMAPPGAIVHKYQAGDVYFDNGALQRRDESVERVNPEDEEIKKLKEEVIQLTHLVNIQGKEIAYKTEQIKNLVRD